MSWTEMSVGGRETSNKQTSRKYPKSAKLSTKQGDMIQDERYFMLAGQSFD